MINWLAGGCAVRGFFMYCLGWERGFLFRMNGGHPLQPQRGLRQDRVKVWEGSQPDSFKCTTYNKTEHKKNKIMIT